MISDYTKDNPMISLKKSGHETACKTHLKILLNDSTQYVVPEQAVMPEIPTCTRTYITSVAHAAIAGHYLSLSM